MSNPRIAVAAIAHIALAFASPAIATAQEPSPPDGYAEVEEGLSVADRERAAMHFELATAHFEDGRYDRALLELQTVRDLTGRDDVLYNMARCYEAMGRTEAAITHYRRFLDAGTYDDLSEDAARRLEGLTAAVDEEPEEVEAGPGAGTIVGLSLGGVGLLVGAVFGALTLVEDAALSEGCGATLSCTGEDLGDIRVYRGVADVAFTLALIGGTAGLIALGFWLSEDEEGGEANAVVVPWVLPGQGGGAAATVRF